MTEEDYGSSSALPQSASERAKLETALVDYLLTHCAHDVWWTSESLGMKNERVKVLRFSDRDDMRVGRMVQELALIRADTVTSPGPQNPPDERKGTE